MSRIAPTLRFVEAEERSPRPADYWRQRPASERLAAVLALHREGNALFKGGNPPFSFELRIIPGPGEDDAEDR